jgi:membrane fusion protein (multidrug efflux system)
MRHIFITLFAAALLAACGKPDGGSAAPGTPAQPAAAPTVLLISAEDLRGPVVTGSLQPERRADLRAEVGGGAAGAQGQRRAGARGELLVRLDDTAIRDSLASADEACARRRPRPSSRPSARCSG